MQPPVVRAPAQLAYLLDSVAWVSIEHAEQVATIPLLAEWHMMLQAEYDELAFGTICDELPPNGLPISRAAV